MDKDISTVLEGWEYRPNEISVRRVVGVDGRTKIQMRLELGLLQMEIAGHPNGQRPHGKESWLEHYLSVIADYRTRHSSDEGFRLDREDCAKLAQEATQYYYRYLSLMVLEEYDGVARDTARNLSVLDLVGQYAEDEQDKLSLDQYRPYIIMMNTRARASICLQRKDYEDAMRIIEDGIQNIETFFGQHHRPEMSEQSDELTFLRNWAEEVEQHRPLSLKERLQRRLTEAVASENFEQAAQLRDMIQKLDKKRRSKNGHGDAGTR